VITIANQSVEYTHRGFCKSQPETRKPEPEQWQERQTAWGEHHFRRLVAELVKNPPATWETWV